MRTERQLFPELVGRHPAMRQLKELMRRVLDLRSTVLIQGESGVGKNLVARLLHTHSARANKPLVRLDCSAIPPELMEAELFGYERGAFTDAVRQKIGLLEAAQGGSVVLDEVADLPLSVQGKLLRAMQDKEFCRLGGTEVIRVDLRVLATTRVDLAEMVRQRLMREDFYYRLNVLVISVPPLREHRSDIPLLSRHLLSEILAQSGRPHLKLHPDTIDCLCRYYWPGNVRELENVLRRALVVANGAVILPEDLPDTVRWPSHETLKVAAQQGLSLEELEKLYIQVVLEQTHHHKGKAAKILGINRKTLLEKRKKYGLD